MTVGFPLRFGTSSVAIGHGWNVLPLGCGGLVTGLFIANDGSMVCRTDVGNIYRWSGTTADYANSAKQWVPLLNYTSLAGKGPAGGDPVCNNNPGGWEHVLAPNNSSVHLAIFADMAGSASLGWIWYSINSGATWGKSNLSFDNDTTGSNYNLKFPSYKLVVDPANPNIAYGGCPYNDGNNAGAYTTLNKAGGSTLATWVSVKTSGSTPIPDTATSGQISSGLAIDASSGTTTIGGQTVTNRIIVPIPSTGIYESTDGGNTFTEIAATAMGASNFWVLSGGFTAEGVYYCLVVHATIGGVWRYKTGTWTNITSGTYAASSFGPGSTFLIIDPRNNATSKAYLSVTGPSGIGQGFTATDASTAASPNWNGGTGGQFGYMKSQSYDLGYINTIFGQQEVNSFVGGFCAQVDPNTGVCWWGGNQSFFYFGSSTASDTPTAAPPSYAKVGAVANVGGVNNSQFTASTSGSSTTVVLTKTAGPTVSIGDVISGRGILAGTTLLSQSSGSAGDSGTYVMSAAASLVSVACVVNGKVTISWSVGRGMEATVAEDALCPPGGTYPVLAVEDLGAPMRGTFTSYPQTMFSSFTEYTCEALEYAASNSSIVVARVTDQGANFADVSGYSTNYGADGTWTQFAGTPTSLWQAQITATISNGSGGAGFILNVTNVAAGGTVFPYAQVSVTAISDNTYGRVQPYGTNGTTGTGGTGTYYLDTSTLLSSTVIFACTPIQGGQTVAVDIDHYVTCPAGLNTITIGQWVIPAYSADRGATWALCAGLPAGGYISRPWSFGPCLKPFAVGYGADLNTVWAALRTGTTLKIYRSTDKGATFSSTEIASWTVSSACEGIYCLSVPGKPGELWVSGSFTNNGGLWRVTNANTASATVDSITMPSTISTPQRFAMGAGAGGGAYPALYLRGFDSGGDSVRRLYEGSYSGTGTSPTWTLFGPTGLQGDLPPTCALQGFQSIRGDWNTYRRLYVPTAGCGLAYYNP